MDQNALVAKYVRAGGKLVSQLRKDSSFGLTAAFWWCDPDQGEWRLVLASVLYRTQGPKAAYTRIAKALAAIAPKRTSRPPLELHDLTATSDQDAATLALSSAVAVEDGEVRIQASTFNGLYVHDALVYFVTPPSQVEDVAREAGLAGLAAGLAEAKS